jgi:hypothetical protein
VRSFLGAIAMLMLRFLKCLFGLHGATEVDYTADDEEIKVCRDCLKEKEK